MDIVGLLMNRERGAGGAPGRSPSTRGLLTVTTTFVSRLNRIDRILRREADAIFHGKAGVRSSFSPEIMI
jgi:hypothetical protein